MKAYLELMKKIIETGVKKEDRTGVGTKSIFGHQMRFNLQKGFPLLTTKKLHIPSIVHELIWFLKGETSLDYLHKHNIKIWDDWATDNELGPIYGKQWRAWGNKGESIDQIQKVTREIKDNPESRRHIVSAWNVSELPLMALPPCHLLFQFNVTNRRLSCQVYQRSADVFIGVPFNIASYAFLTHIIAQQCNLEVGELVWVGGDCHIYLNHMKQVNIQLGRKPKELPSLKFKRIPEKFDEYHYEDFDIQGYDAHPHILGDVAI